MSCCSWGLAPLACPPGSPGMPWRKSGSPGMPWRKSPKSPGKSLPQKPPRSSGLPQSSSPSQGPPQSSSPPQGPPQSSSPVLRSIPSPWSVAIHPNREPGSPIPDGVHALHSTVPPACKHVWRAHWAPCTPLRASEMQCIPATTADLAPHNLVARGHS